MAESRVRRIGPGELADTPGTPGMTRRQAVATEGMWAGVVETGPGTVSGWHHHGEYETTIHVLDGALRLEFGPAGRESLDGLPGDFLYVPPFAIHREANPTNGPGRAVVVRAGSGDPVFNVDGPEPV